MYILQEYDKDLGVWSDLYSHNDYNYLLSFKSVQSLKHPNRKYRVIEVIEIV